MDANAFVVTVRGTGVKLFEFVMKASSTDPCREILRSVLIDRAGGPHALDAVRLVATDGRRMHMARWDSAQWGELPEDGVYEARKMAELERKGRSRFGTPLCRLVLVKKSGNYPEYRRVMLEAGDDRPAKDVKLRLYSVKGKKVLSEKSIYLIHRAGTPFRIDYLMEAAAGGMDIARVKQGCVRDGFTTAGQVIMEREDGAALAVVMGIYISPDEE